VHEVPDARAVADLRTGIDDRARKNLHRHQNTTAGRRAHRRARTVGSDQHSSERQSFVTSTARRLARSVLITLS